MSSLQTKNFGTLSYQPDSLVEFPAGLPSFETRRRYLPISLPSSEPIVFLQSEEDPDLCFVTLPVLAVDPKYRLLISDEDRALIGISPEDPVEPSPLVLCLAVVAIKEEGPTANLLAPIVINMASRKGVQAIGPGSDYSWQHPLLPAGEEAAAPAVSRN
jgi:flagellar assembly factor FliW